MDELKTLNIPDNLNLSSIDIQKVPEKLISGDVSDYLRGLVDQIRRENQTLRQELETKNQEIEQDRRKIEELIEKTKNYESCNNNEFTSATQLASNKIMELSKKLREKNSEIEVYKSKCSKLENQLSKFKSIETITPQEIKSESQSVESDDLKKLQDKLTYVTSKWTDEKNLNSKLKKDLKIANKWLQQEVGDKFETLLTLNNTPNSNWRGRAQIICDLQQKNQELKEKLKAYQENKDSKCTMCSEISRTKIDDKLETTQKENLELKASNTELKRKLETVKARCRALENEYSLLKTKTETLTKIQNADQEQIYKLKMQLSQFKELKDENLKQKEQIIKNLQEENESLKVELVREKCVSENKSKELLEKNDNIELLNKRIRSSRPTSSYIRKPENPETKAINKLEVDCLRLLELTELQNSRLEEERQSHSKTQQRLRAEKQKCAKLEANLARMQLEQQNPQNRYSNKLNTSKLFEQEVKDKLELAEENIKALTTRLEIESMERKRDLQQFCKILKSENGL